VRDDEVVPASKARRTVLTHLLGFVAYVVTAVIGAVFVWSAGFANTTCQPDETPGVSLGTVRLVIFASAVALAAVCSASALVLSKWCRAPAHALPWVVLGALSVIVGGIWALAVQQGHWCF